MAQPSLGIVCILLRAASPVMLAILALVMMVYAAKYIASTPTAIMGALEPLTAVLIGIFLFGELFTLRLAFGIVLIFSSVIIIALYSNQMGDIPNNKPTRHAQLTPHERSIVW